MVELERTKLSDLELAAQSAQGDLASLEFLVRRYFVATYGLMYRLCGDRAIAEDLVVETFSRMGRTIRSFRGPSKFSSWLYRLAIVTAADWRYRRLKFGSAGKRLELVAGGREAAMSDEPVLVALRSLDDFEREALVLSVFEELSRVEIAEILGCAESAVAWQIFTARRKLLKFFK